MKVSTPVTRQPSHRGTLSVWDEVHVGIKCMRKLTGTISLQKTVFPQNVGQPRTLQNYHGSACVN